MAQAAESDQPDKNCNKQRHRRIAEQMER